MEDTEELPVIQILIVSLLLVLFAIMVYTSYILE